MEKVIGQLEARLTEDPENWHVRSSLVGALIRAGRWHDADRHCTQLLELAPDDRKALRLGRDIAARLGELARADSLQERLNAVEAELRSSRTLEAFVDEGGAGSLLVRTDFSDDSAWVALTHQVTGRAASLIIVDDRRFEGLDAAGLAALTGSHPYYVFAADSTTLEGEHTLLVVDRHHEPGRWFRVALDEVASVEANLAIANMDFADFADFAHATDQDHVFRGFV